MLVPVVEETLLLQADLTTRVMSDHIVVLLSDLFSICYISYIVWTLNCISLKCLHSGPKADQGDWRTT